jgi:ABC-type transport system substrate-binding protein
MTHRGMVLGICALCACSSTEPHERTSSALREGRPRGVAAFDMVGDLDGVDPAFMYFAHSWKVEHATCAKLLNYGIVDGEAVLMPEIAARLPRVSADGRRYSFQIRDSYAFSPPSTEWVTAASMKWTIERVLSLTDSPGAFFLEDIEKVEVGGDGETLVITLREARPDFMHRIAMPFACAVPLATGLALTEPPPMAGPYYFAEYQQGASLVLRRNPSYDGPRRARLDEIRFTIGRSPAASVPLVESGAVDYVVTSAPAAFADDLAARYGEASPAAAAGHQQYFVHPQPGFWYVAMNTSRPWFAGEKMRQAVSYAIDRPALAHAFRFEPYARYLPAAFPSAPADSVYPLDGPDVARAAALIAEAGGITQTEPAVMYTFNNNAIGPELAAIVRANLRAVGIEVEVKEFSRAEQHARAATRGEPFDLTLEGWVADYPDPASFLNVLLDGDGIRDEDNVNVAYFDDPVFNQLLDEATLVTGPARDETYRSLALAAARDHAPWAVFASLSARDFFSSRMGCQTFHPLYGMDLASLCLRK